jgi:hypothetical protein
LHNQHNALLNIARAPRARRLARTRETLAAAIHLVGEMGTMYRGHSALEVASRLAAAQGDWRDAARFQGAADATVARMGGVQAWFDDPVRIAERQTPAELGDEAYQAAHDGGRGLPLEAALDEARNWLGKPGSNSAQR